MTVVLKIVCCVLIAAALLAGQFGCATTTPKYLTYNITTSTNAPVQQIADKISQIIFDIKLAELTAKVPYYLKHDSLGITLKNRANKLFDQQTKYSERFNEKSTAGGLAGFGIPTILYLGTIGVMRSREGNGSGGWAQLQHVESAAYAVILFPIYLLVVPFSIHYCSRFAAGPQVPPEHSQALSTMIAEYNQAVGIHPQSMMPIDSLNK